MNYLIEQLCQKINKSTLLTNPWPHIRIPNFLPLPLYEEMLEQHNSVNWSRLWEIESSWGTIRHDGPCDPENWDTFNALASKPFYNAICSKFNISNIEFETVQRFKLDDETNSLQVPHRDMSISMMTLQIFLQPESYVDGGTVLMSSETDEAEELALQPNFCNIFLNTEDSWHTVNQRGYVRKSMVQRWTKV